MATAQLRADRCVWAVIVAVALAPMQVVAAPVAGSGSSVSTAPGAAPTETARGASTGAQPGAAPTGPAASGTQAGAAPTGAAASGTQAGAAAQGGASSSAVPASAAEGMSGPAPGTTTGAFTSQDGWTTPKPGAQTSNGGQPQERRWHVRQAPLAGAESSWGPPGGQMPEYAEFSEPQMSASKGPPAKGTARIVVGAILGPVGFGLAVAGIVGATTSMLGDHKRLSVPMIGVGLVSSAIGWGLFADGVLRRKRFMRWQARGGQVTISPTLVPGRLAGVSLGLRF